MEGTWLYHREDARPILLVVFFFCYQVSIFIFVADPWLALLAVGVPHFFLQIPLASAMHVAIHGAVFRVRGHDFIYGILYALCIGFTRTCFKLDHLTHHKLYLDQKRDPNTWMHKGRRISRLHYCTYNLFAMYPRTWRLARTKNLRTQRSWLSEVSVILILVAALIAVEPGKTLAVFVYPMVYGVFGTYFWSHHQHAGLCADNVFEGTRSYVSTFYNHLAFNVGYHTAHHLRPGLHWTKLPELHDQIKDSIPRNLNITSVPWNEAKYTQTEA